MTTSFFKAVTIFCLISATAALAMAQGMMAPPSTLPSLPGFQGRELDENMVLPQFAVGDNYTTSLLLSNMGNMLQMQWLTPVSLQLTGTIYFYHQDGTPLAVSINGASAAATYAFSLAASQSVSLDLAASGADTSGWALITVNDDGSSPWGMMNGQQMMRANRIMATAYYTYKSGSQVISRAGVTPSIYEMQRYLTSLTPVQVQDGIDTGVAIVNTSAQTVTVNLTLRSASGDAVATRQLVLPAGNQIARYIDETQLFGGAFSGNFRGFVEVDTPSDGVVVMGMLLTGGILTSIPTMHYGPISMMLP